MAPRAATANEMGEEERWGIPPKPPARRPLNPFSSRFLKNCRVLSGFVGFHAWMCLSLLLPPCVGAFGLVASTLQIPTRSDKVRQGPTRSDKVQQGRDR